MVVVVSGPSGKPWIAYWPASGRHIPLGGGNEQGALEKVHGPEAYRRVSLSESEYTQFMEILQR